MPNAIRIHEQGGPEVMRWESVDLPELGSEESAFATQPLV